MVISAACSAQYTFAFSVAQSACPTLPEIKAAQAIVSVSDAASENAEEGEARARGCVVKGPDSLHSTLIAKGRIALRPPEASTSRRPRAWSGWCLWARGELDSRPHQRGLPCGR
eukprot:3955944-Pleurochrysis_carterae.AAC.1